MVLIIAEKPSVARDLARVLGVPARGTGVFRGPRHVITWCIGHLVELEEPAAYDDAWKRWRLESLPMLPARFRLRPSRGTLAQWRVVRDLLRAHDFTEVVNACDAGREGELIYRFCVELAGAAPPVQRRLWVSSLTDAALRAGFANLRPGADLDALAAAARCRSQADWLVGMNATRVLTVRAGVRGRVLSVGRVQTPTLALVVARQAAIAAFVPERYDEVEGAFTTAPGDRFTGTYTLEGKTRLDPTTAAAIVARDTPAPARVESVEHAVVREPPPLLFDLTSLQKTANRRFGFSARRTLDLAQALYERHKVISYPRTDSRHLPGDVRAEVPAILDALAPTYAAAVAVARPALAGRLPRVFDDRKVGDHHAIIPTAKAPRSLPDDERKIYDLVARRFLAAFHPDAEIARTTVTVAVQASEVDRYLARGKVRLRPGWHDIAGVVFDEALLPTLSDGQPVTGRYRALAKQTEPPKPYTEATLLAAMESAGKDIADEELRAAMRDSGLGTPATRAAIIETLLDRGYLVREAKTLRATPVGVELIERIPVESLKSPELTGQWEARLARIARGEEAARGFMDDIATYVRGFVAAIAAAPAPVVAEEVVGRCPRCGGAVRERFKTFDCAACDFKLWKSIAGKKVSAALAAVLLRARKTKVLPGFRSKAGKRFRAALLLDETGAVKLDFGARPVAVAAAESTTASAATCPKCRQGGIVVGRAAWGCSRWREGCRLVVPFEAGGAKLTPKQLEALLTRGVTRKTRNGRLRLDLEADPPVVRHER